MGKPGTSDVVSPVSEYIGCRRERGEVKHLSTRRRRKQLSDSVSSGERKRRMAKPCTCDTRRGLCAWCCGVCGLWSADQSAGNDVLVEVAWDGLP
jgi:hypothetical protein